MLKIYEKGAENVWKSAFPYLFRNADDVLILVNLLLKTLFYPHQHVIRHHILARLHLHPFHRSYPYVPPAVHHTKIRSASIVKRIKLDGGLDHLQGGGGRVTVFPNDNFFHAFIIKENPLNSPKKRINNSLFSTLVLKSPIPDIQEQGK